MLSKTNKSLILLLLFLGVLAIFLGYFQIRGAIYAPFKQIAQKTTLPTQEQIIPILQDTDKDGLSDFDEEFVYHTNTRNEDTDSDSFTDKEEVDAKSDPLNSESTPYHTPKNSSGEESSLEKTFSQEENVSEEISIKEIKDLLINQTGLSREIVDKLDDKTLKELYNETKKETGIDLNELGAPSNQQPQFSDLDVSQMRQLLIEQGVDEKMLDSIDDETLKSMFLQSLLPLDTNN